MNARDALGRLRRLGVPAVTTADAAAVLGVSAGAATQMLRRLERAQARSEGTIPFQAVGIVQPPYEYEDRLRPLPVSGLKHLKVLVPEPHDLALMKVARGEAHDLVGIEDIHRASPLSLDTLVARYEESRVQFVGNPADLRLAFLALVARLFGRWRSGVDMPAAPADGRSLGEPVSESRS
jgi:hypothetical protein